MPQCDNPEHADWAPHGHTSKFDVCKNCEHITMWHLHADGPQPRCCNFPKCRCEVFEPAAELPLAG